MAKRSAALSWLRALQRPALAAARKIARDAQRQTALAAKQAAALTSSRPAARPAARPKKAATGVGTARAASIAGVATGPAGSRAFRLYRPPGMTPGERLPVVVMLHGCGQDAERFALSTGMNRLAAHARFLVLYPQQDRRANLHRCWNWFDTRTGRAAGEAALILNAIDQVCLFHGGDARRVAVAGLSAGASMAALLATLHPTRFKAVAIHSGVPPGVARSGATALQAMRGLRPPGPALPGTAHGEPWPPLLVIQGGRDEVVVPGNGTHAADVWAGHHAARARPVREVRRGQRYPMQVTDYRVGRHTVVTLVQIPALGHAWSGGSARHDHGDARGPDAARIVWSFASKQFAAAAPEACGRDDSR